MKVVRIAAVGDGGAWHRGDVVVECSPCEEARLEHLADVFHPDLTVVRVTPSCESDGGRGALSLRVCYPPANRFRLDALLQERMAELIPCLDMAPLGAVGR